jgi:hypothetical protein
MERRQFIVGASTAAGIALAGCLGGGGGESPEDKIETDSPEAVVESWNRGLNEIDLEELEALAEAAYHSQSPLFERYQSNNESQGQYTDDVSIESVETTVLAENLNESTLQEELRGFDVSDETIAQLANDEETARVEATVTSSVEGFDRTSTETTEYVVATEDGEWQLLLGI